MSELLGNILLALSDTLRNAGESLREQKRPPSRPSASTAPPGGKLARLVPAVESFAREVSATGDHPTGMVRASVPPTDFDAFIAYNARDREAVTAIVTRLKARGITPWIDTEQAPPGRWFQDIIQDAIPRVKSAVIVLGPKGLGRWQQLEIRTFISECIDTGIPVIPLLLPGAPAMPGNLRFLRELGWVKIGQLNDEMWLNELIFGITGVRP